MWTLILSAVLGAVNEEPVWTIASDGSMVQFSLAPAESGAPQSFAAAMRTHHKPESRLKALVDLPRPKPRPKSAADLAVEGRRLPGPRHWACPSCGSSSCLMYLGSHLMRSHNVSTATINRVTYRRLPLLHDNLENANYRSPPVAKSQPVRSACTACQGGNCVRFPVVRRLLRGG